MYLINLFTFRDKQFNTPLCKVKNPLLIMPIRGWFIQAFEGVFLFQLILKTTEDTENFMSSVCVIWWNNCLRTCWHSNWSQPNSESESYLEQPSFYFKDPSVNLIWITPSFQSREKASDFIISLWLCCLSLVSFSDASSLSTSVGLVLQHLNMEKVLRFKELNLHDKNILLWAI